MAATARKANASGDAMSAPAEVGADVGPDVEVEVPEAVLEDVLDTVVVKEPIFWLVVIHLLICAWKHTGL